MAKGLPFLLFPWQNSFLQGLKTHIMAETGQKPGSALIITPNERPWRYFPQYFANNKKAVVLPQTVTFSKVAAAFSRHAQPRPIISANILDQVALLKECIEQLSGMEPALAARFADMSLPQFLPWGMRLANLLEDIFCEGICPANIAAPEGDADKFAIALLGALNQIATAYQQKMAASGFGTPGLDAFIAASNAENIPPEFLPGPERQVYIAGFSLLNGAQLKLFKSLWLAGARICIQGDPLLISGHNYDSACQPLADWQKLWGTDLELAEEYPDTKPVYSFYAGYDAHSQLLQLTRDLQETDKKSSAIVLPDTSLLMPTLHHLDDKNVNISMGYPIIRTLFHSLLHDIFSIFQRKRPVGKFYWHDLQKIISHPLLLILKSEGGLSLRPALNTLDSALRKGSKFVSLEDLLTIAADEHPTTDFTPLAETMAILITNLENIQTTADLAAYLQTICDLFIARGAHALKYFSLDAECISRLQESILPVLSQNLLANEPLEPSVLMKLLDMLLQQERIPFEAADLKGLQIIGVLETRLLQFDNVYILDASDDLLPGTQASDPLLPDNLRRAIGLPNAKTRDKITAYNIARLCSGAKIAHFYWTEGLQLSDLAQSKRSKSRLVERLIWEWEQVNGQILKPGIGPLQAATSQASLSGFQIRSLAIGPELRNILTKCLEKPISASFVNEYLSCPLKFAFHRILKLYLPAEVNEDDDPAAVGSLTHDVLRQTLLSAKDTGQNIAAKGTPLQLAELVEQIFKASVDSVKTILPVDSFIHFELAGPQLLRKYWQSFGEGPVCKPLEDGQEPSCIIKALEADALGTITLGHRRYKLRGTIDRIDRRNGRDFILDYKTGSVKNVESALWEDANFFARLKAALEEDVPSAEGSGLFTELRQRMPDIQLPFYMLLAENIPGIKPENAGYIFLRSQEEKLLLSQAANLEDAKEYFRLALAFILRRMESASSFEPVQEQCEWCDYRAICAVENR